MIEINQDKRVLRNNFYREIPVTLTSRKQNGRIKIMIAN